MSSPWVMSRHEPPLERLGEVESLFTVANGSLGFRGFPPEGSPAHHAGVCLNGFYESGPIHYGESAYGFPQRRQTMLDAPDARLLSVFLDGEACRVDTGMTEVCALELDMRRGVSSREVTWWSTSGARLRLRWDFLVSYRHAGIAALRLTVEGEGALRVESGIALPPAAAHADPADPRTSGAHGGGGLRLVEAEADEAGALRALLRTQESGLSLICGCALRCVEGEARIEVGPAVDGIPTHALHAQDRLVLEEMVYYAHGETMDEEAVEAAYRAFAEAGAGLTFADLEAQQREVLDDFWRDADVRIEGDPRYQEALRFNLFQLFQSAGRDGRTSLAAKGLSGNGYEGHYFWDTEIYAMPLFTTVAPELARRLLEYRISTLDEARRRAAEMSEAGALYPWRTINGAEASAYFPAGTAQYHINADIAYALLQYVDVTGDTDLMVEGGAEVLFETARLWMSLGFFNPRRGGRFCIHEVTGPDEYSALVDDNFYTNSMVAHHLLHAAAWWVRLEQERPEFFADLRERLALDDAEREGWAEASAKMHLPFDAEVGVNLQDDAFLDRERWDFEGTPADKYPLLLHFHPLVIYRHQVIKQADIILAHVLLPQNNDRAQRRRDFHYYEALTTGDSSLSACAQGIAALELGERALGWRHAQSTNFVDLENRQGNTRDGLHMASMAGAWMITAYGFGGLRYDGGVPTLRPQPLPEGWSALGFNVRSRGRLIEVLIRDRVTTLRRPEGHTKPAELVYEGRVYQVGEEPIVIHTTPRFEGAIFDLDGVIASTDVYHYRAWKRLAMVEGWAFDEALNQRLRGVSRRRSLEIIMEANDARRSEEEILALMDRKNRWYRESLEELTTDALLPGTLALLEGLWAAGIKIAIASASRNAPLILERLGITDLIDFIAPVERLVRGKPDPEIFLVAAMGLGLEPKHCVGFEDAPPGVEAIRGAGMKIVAVAGAVADLEADIHCADLSSITLEDLRGLFVPHDAA